MRRLDANMLGVGATPAVRSHSSNRPDDPPLPDDHPLLLTVRGLLDRFGGFIFTGPPGTSKSYYAAKIADRLTDGDKSRIRFTQFHQSYQYEDFMEGFVPRKDGSGFTLQAKLFLEMCREAGENKNRNKLFVLVIDELSRGDSGRIFGEALTYVERSKRGLPVTLASGDSMIIPDNVVILATMNPLDRGVDEVDAAFERRFAKIPMDPDRDLLREQLERNGLPETLRGRVVGFFDMINGRAKANPQAAVGHTYFFDVTDEASLQLVWDYQLRFLIDKAMRLNADDRAEVEAGWNRMFEGLPDDDATS
ncbi:MAG TPA: AAA family ATPase [Solirubrobacteraceae bacterium]|nr:AAA family ATPase [Solirubrobacteraceae bacterium]